MAELVDALVSGTSGRKAVQVRVLFRAHFLNTEARKALLQCFYCFRMDMLNRLGYKGEINSLTGKIQKDALILQQKQKELEQVISEKRQLKESDFTAWIVQVSKYMGYRIDRKKITVSEFIEMNKQMEREIKSKLKLR